MNQVEELLEALGKLRTQTDTLYSRVQQIETRKRDDMRVASAPLPEVPHEEPPVEEKPRRPRRVVFAPVELKPAPEKRKINRKPRELTLQDMLKKDRHAGASPERTQKVIDYFLEHRTANLAALHELVGDIRSLVLHYIKVFKKHGLIIHEGSKKQGHYAVTEKGENLFKAAAEA